MLFLEEVIYLKKPMGSPSSNTWKLIQHWTNILTRQWLISLEYTWEKFLTNTKDLRGYHCWLMLGVALEQASTWSFPSTLPLKASTLICLKWYNKRHLIQVLKYLYKWYVCPLLNIDMDRIYLQIISFKYYSLIQCASKDVDWHIRWTS